VADYPKHIKKLLREFMTEAYERELHRELTKLDASFAEWRAGKIGSGELSYRIHEYETGPSRELFQKYNNSPHDMSVAYAIVVGILKPDEVPGELLEAIRGPLSFYQSLKADGELGEPGKSP
jgi:hypothetical protein